MVINRRRRIGMVGTPAGKITMAAGEPAGEDARPRSAARKPCGRRRDRDGTCEAGDDRRRGSHAALHGPLPFAGPAGGPACARRANGEEVVQERFIAMHDGRHRLREEDKALSYLKQAVVNRRSRCCGTAGGGRMRPSRRRICRMPNRGPCRGWSQRGHHRAARVPDLQRQALVPRTTATCRRRRLLR